jgi:hypothetical protein
MVLALFLFDIHSTNSECPLSPKAAAQTAPSWSFRGAANGQKQPLSVIPRIRFHSCTERMLDQMPMSVRAKQTDMKEIYRT